MESAPKARKRHLVGFETEFLILEENGVVSSRADELIDAANARHILYPVLHDYTHNMFEVASIANVKVRKGAHAWLQSMEKIIETAKSMDLRVYPYGTYPGQHHPTPRTEHYYRMCEEVIGPEKYVHHTGHSTGFHLHYCLPYGTFNRETRSLKQLFRSKYRDTLLNLHNMIIAMDPALTNFMESSPFVDGAYIAKDSRVVLYRAMQLGKGAGAIKGLYSELPMFGKLPRYADTLSDLIMLTEKRYETWRDLVEERCPEYMGEVDSRHPLQFNWGPLRINRVGTFEYRGLDINLPSYMIGTSLIFKYVLKKVKNEGLRITPSDVGIKSPFKIEGDRMHVPPYAYINQVLQVKSAVHGLADDEIYRYTKNLVSLALKSMPGKSDPGLARIKSLMECRKTKSDELIDAALRDGQDLSCLDEEFARTLALDSCSELENEVQKMIGKELLIESEN